MPASLSRIEFEYVINIFAETKPVLYVCSKNGVQQISSYEYEINNRNITVNKKLSAPENEKASVSFFHKKRKMYFISRIFSEHKNGKPVFGFCIPDKIFKAAKDKQKTEYPFIQLFYKTEVILHASALFFQKEKNQSSLPLSADFSGLEKIFCANRKHLPESESLNIQKKTLLAFLKNENLNITSSCPSFLFFDSQFILLFCKKTSLPEKDFKELDVRFNFTNRTILCRAKQNFFLPYNIKNETGFLLLEITDAAEEDKRFLHEQTHTEKYGKLII